MPEPPQASQNEMKSRAVLRAKLNWQPVEEVSRSAFRMASSPLW